MENKNNPIVLISHCEEGFAVEMNGTPNDATTGIGQLLGELIIQIAHRNNISRKEVFSNIMAELTLEIMQAITSVDEDKEEMN